MKSNNGLITFNVSHFRDPSEKVFSLPVSAQDKLLQAEAHESESGPQIVLVFETRDKSNSETMFTFRLCGPYFADYYEVHSENHVMLGSIPYGKESPVDLILYRVENQNEI